MIEIRLFKLLKKWEIGLSTGLVIFEGFVVILQIKNFELGEVALS
jgi:hypothetical protein